MSSFPDHASQTHQNQTSRPRDRNIVQGSGPHSVTKPKTTASETIQADITNAQTSRTGSLSHSVNGGNSATSIRDGLYKQVDRDWTRSYQHATKTMGANQDSMSRWRDESMEEQPWNSVGAIAIHPKDARLDTRRPNPHKSNTSKDSMVAVNGSLKDHE